MNFKEKFNLSDISLKKVIILLVVVIILIFIIVKTFSVGSTNSEGSISDQSSASLVEVTVIKVSEGDTIWVEYEGYNKKIRLIGIDCPEISNYTSDRDSSDGAQAADYVSSLIEKGDTVYLQTDTSDEDDYGRYLRYVWLEEPTDTDDEDEICSKMLNALILINGYGEAVATEPDVYYSDLFTELQTEAEEDTVGLWAD